MSRVSEIDVQVDSGKSISTLKEIKNAFIDLNNSRNLLGKDGIIKLEVQLKGLDVKTLEAIANGLDKVKYGMNSLDEASQKVSKNGQKVNITLKHTENNITRVGKSGERASQGVHKLDDSLLRAIVTFGAVSRLSKNVIGAFAGLNTAVFDVGVASQMNVRQINELNSSFLELSKNVPSSAKEMALAVDALIRTGRTFEEARGIIAETAILSTASGSELKDTAQVVTKVMVSLQVNADNVTETLKTMHSTAIKTATDMKYLGNAFAQVAGSASVLTKQSGLYGKELDDYKQKVLDVSMASIGAMGNLGLSASSAGTKIKQMFGKMVAGEKTARTLFDQAMKTQNIMENGKVLNFDYISELTKKDLPKALELLSKLYNTGKLNTQVMQKMFTARHFQEVSSLLSDINGDVEGFVNRMAKGVDQSDDFRKKMMDVAEQWKVLKNSVMSAFSVLGEFSIKALSGIVGMSQEVLNTLEDLGKGTVTGFIGDIAQLSTGFLSLHTGIALSVKTLGTLKPILLNPLALKLTAIIALVATVGSLFQKVKERTLDFGLNSGKTFKGINDLSQEIKGVENAVKDSQDKIASMGVTDTTLTTFDALNSVLLTILGTSNDIVKALEAVGRYKTLDSFKESAYEGVKEVEKELEEHIKKLEGYKRRRNAIISSMKNILTGENNEFQKKSDAGTMEKQKKFVDEYTRIMEQSVSLTEKESRITNIGKALGFDERESERMIRALSQYNKEFDVMAENISGTSERVKELHKNLAESRKGLEEQENINKDITDSYTAILKNDLSKIYKDSGMLLLFEDNSLEALKGVEAIMSFYDDSISAVLESEMDAIERTKYKKVEEYSEMLRNTYDQTMTDHIEDEYAKEVGAIDDVAKGLEGTMLEQKSIIESTRLEIIEFLKTIPHLDAFKEDTLGYLQMKTTRNQLAFNGGSASELEAIDRTIRIREERLKLLNQKEQDRADKKSKTEKKEKEYVLSYNRFLSDRLDLELEIAKIMQSQSKQSMLDYEYSKKKSELKSREAQDNIQDIRRSASDSGFNFDGFTNSAQVEAKLEEIRKQYGNKSKGEQGKIVKEEVDFLNKLGKAMVDGEKIVMDRAMLPLKEFQSLMSSVPKLMQDSYTVLMGTNKTILNSLYSESLEYAKQTVVDGIDMLRSSWVDNPLIQGLSQYNVEEVLQQQMLVTKEIEQQAKKLMSRKKGGASLTEEEEKVVDAYKLQTTLLEDLVQLSNQKLENTKTELDIELEKLAIYNKMGSVLSSLGSGLGFDKLEGLGGLFSSFEKMSSQFKKNGSVSFSELIDFKNDNWAEAFGKSMENALESVNFGGAIGSWIGQLTGGGASSQAGGALGGLIGGLGGSDKLAGLLGISSGGAGLAISAGMSLIGGLFGKDDAKAQAKAQKKTEQANKEYSENTDALNKLSQSMVGLLSGVNGLKTSLLQSVSRIPTIGKLARTEKAMQGMVDNIKNNRDFSDVSYQVTKHKKGKKGFLGIGATAGTSWTETVRVPVQDLLNKWGGKGTNINDLSTDQLQQFSSWLKKYDLGEQDNFSVLAESIENYALALKTYEDNVKKFFYNATMEGFKGISIQKEEDLREQYVEFYKNLGYEMNSETTDMIDKLVEETATSVEIMGDIRENFINSWAKSGKDAGSIFLKSMAPYFDATINNMSQVFFDVYYSDMTDILEESFLKVSEQLVVLKKQGADMKWSDVGNTVKDNFNSAFEAILSAKNESASFNDLLLEIQKNAIEAGMSLGDLGDLGLLTDTQTSVIDNFKSALMSDSSALESLGSFMGDTIGEALADNLINNMMSEKVLQMSSTLDKVLSGNLGYDSLAGLASEALSVGIMMEEQRKRLESIKSMFDFNGSISYDKQESNIQYTTGTSQSVVNNYYISSDINAGNIIQSDDLESLTKSQIDLILNFFRDKGIYLD